MQNINAGILLISTRKYKQFVAPLINQIDEYFLPDTKKTIFVFTDELQELESKSNIEQIIIPPYKFPYPTLLRYMLFDDNKEQLKKCTHLTYMDVDMAIVDTITPEEFLTDEGLTVVRHPGFFISNGWGNGDNENPKESTSYMPPENRKHYYCGGVQSGTSEAYLELSKILSANIKLDELNGVMAIYHDETHYNKYVNENYGKIPMKELTPTFCMVEQPLLREAWGIAILPVKIIALAKNHAEIRQ